MDAVVKLGTDAVLSIYVSSPAMVNELTLAMMDAGFLINAEPHYRSEGYESCFLAGEHCRLRVCCPSEPAAV